MSRKQGPKCDIPADRLGVSAGMSRFEAVFCDISAGSRREVGHPPPEYHILRVGWVRRMGWGLTERHWCPLIWRIYVYAYAAADAVQAVVRIVMKDIAGEPRWPGVGDRQIRIGNGVSVRPRNRTARTRPRGGL